MIRVQENSSVKYYSSNDAMIMIGDIFVDEAIAVAYSVRESKIPIYSYNKKYFSKMATGKVIVQGTITINYIHDDYMNNILREYKAGKDAGSNLLKLPATEYIQSPDTIKSNKAQIAKILSSDPARRKEIFEDIRQRKEAIKRLVNESPDDIFSESSLPSQTRNNFSMFYDYGPVNILVTHENPYLDSGSVRRIIKNVHIIGLEQSMHPTGQTQVETYSFLAEQVI